METDGKKTPSKYLLGKVGNVCKQIVPAYSFIICGDYEKLMKKPHPGGCGFNISIKKFTWVKSVIVNQPFPYNCYLLQSVELFSYSWG